MGRFVDVVVPLAVDGVFTYGVPAWLEGRVGVGSLVRVAFGGRRRYTGLVVGVREEGPEGVEVKEVEGLGDEGVRLGEVQVGFLLWVGRYYMASAGEVLRAALPAGLRLESFTEVALAEGEVDLEGLGEVERRVAVFLAGGGFVAVRDVERGAGVRDGMGVVRGLMERGVVRVREVVDGFFRERRVKVVRWGRSFGEGELGGVLEGLGRAEGQRRVLCRWVEEGREEMERGEFLRVCGGSAGVLRGLVERGVLAVEERVVSRLDEEVEGGEMSGLSEEQEEALGRVRGLFGERGCVLLKGVTGSGKTEVYIHLIKEYLDRGEQVLYMLPEIGLTVQIVQRLRRVFGGAVGVYHSGMSDRARVELWRRQCGEGAFGLVLGVRSSVFLPFRRLGLVIVDEEHDGSYKQREPAPRYNGRDAAVMLGRMWGAKVLLGSATPSFESYGNARRGKYGLVELRGRYGGVEMPEVVLADVKEARRRRVMEGCFTPVLVEEMGRVLGEGNQVILFQNRRGYSSYVQCERCGAIPRCRRCDVSLTYYKGRGALVCRYCGAVVEMPGCCPECGEGRLAERTPGTERVEEEVGRLFPGVRVARMDLEVVGSRGRLRRVIRDFEEGRTDVLVGTQMVAKGLDFERVKLVGVMDGDGMVGFPDFRAEERAFSMLMQVGGRSGRRGERGKVVVQAADVGHRVYRWLKEGGYEGFYEELAEERRLFGYPPFGRLVEVELRCGDVVELRHAGNGLARGLRERLGGRVCGPAEPEVGRIGGMSRLVVLVKVEEGVSPEWVKGVVREEVERVRGERGGLRIFCDVDP